MSDYTDAMIDRIINYVPERTGLRRRGFQYGAGMHKWRLKDGTLVDMHTMSDEHIQNAIKLSETKGNTAKAKQLADVLEKRK